MASPECPSKLQSIGEALVCKLMMRWVIYGRTLCVLFSVKNFLLRREGSCSLFVAPLEAFVYDLMFKENFMRAIYRIRLRLVWS